MSGYPDTEWSYLSERITRFLLPPAVRHRSSGEVITTEDAESAEEEKGSRCFPPPCSPRAPWFYL